MKTKDFKELINLYFDGELKKEKEILLFTNLSQNEEARIYFKEMNLLKTAAGTLTEEYPDYLDTRILSKLEDKTQVVEKPVDKFHFITAYSVAAILLILSLFLFSEVNSYRQSVEAMHRQVVDQKQTIEMLFNSLPGVIVKSSM